VFDELAQERADQAAWRWLGRRLPGW
jgi:hypothetical protein